MEKKVIELEVNSNLGESISDLKALKRQLKETAAGSEEFKKIFNQIDDLEDKIKSAKNSSSDWIDSLENAGGPLGAVGAGLNKAKVATQSFGGALKATGIGLFVSLIGGLVAAFRDNEAATKKLQPLLDGLGKIFQGVFRAVEPLFNTLVDLATDALPYVTKGIGMVYSAMMAYFTFLKESGGGALKILKGIFTLDSDAISSGIDQIGGSFKKTTTAYTDSMKRFSEGSKELTKTEKEEAEKREEARKKALEKKEAAEEKAKQAAIKKAEEEAAKLKAIADKKLADDMKSAQDAINILNTLSQNNETPAEKAEREYQDRKAVLEANNLSTEELTRQHLNNLAKIELDIADKKIKKEDSEFLRLQELTLEKDEYDKLVLTQKYESEYLAAEGNGELQKQLKIKLDNDILAIDQATADAQNKIEELKTQAKQKALSAYSSTLKTAASLLGESTDAGKAAAIAATTIDTIQSGVSAFKGMTAAVPGPVGIGLGVVAAAGALASGYASVKKIIAVKTPKGGGGGGSAPSGGSATGGGGAAPQFNVVGNSGVNQLADVMNTQQQTPVKAYVVPSDVTTGQSLDRNIIRNASLG